MKIDWISDIKQNLCLCSYENENENEVKNKLHKLQISMRDDVVSVCAFVHAHAMRTFDMLKKNTKRLHLL